MSAAIEVHIFDTILAQPLPDKPTLTLLFDAAVTTARTLIARRVEAELQRVGAQYADKCFQGLIQPTEAEARANGYAERSRRKLDPEHQINKAITAFERNKFVLLVDDRQILDLDEEIRVTDATIVTFLRLIPLAGG
jgi:hypothetical protein